VPALQLPLSRAVVVSAAKLREKKNASAHTSRLHLVPSPPAPPFERVREKQKKIYAWDVCNIYVKRERCTYVCMCMYVCIHARMCVCVCVRERERRVGVRACACTCLCAMCLGVLLCVCMCLRVCERGVSLHVPVTRVCVCVFCLCVCGWMHVCMNA
jgi:hypothetical protein